jgi:oligosaccharide reducing-end xylanase
MTAGFLVFACVPETSTEGGSGGSSPGGGSPGAGGTANTGGSATGGVIGSSGGRATGGSPAGGTATASGGKASGGTPSGGATGSSGSNGGGTTPGNGCTPPAAYENLFVTVSGHTPADTDTKINAAWNQLYNPSNANTVYYNGPGSDESYVKDVANNDVRTEGMSYGMMTAVQLGKQTEFDRLWAWVKNHMAQGTGQIAWQCRADGSKLATGGAPDGEEYFATALIFASKRWGNSSGRFNYATEAQWVLNLIRTQYFNSSYHIVQFYANSGNTDASYVLPAFYQVWACFDTANAAFWDASVTAAHSFFHAAADSNGVIGDRQSFTGQTQQGAGSDAKRCVMNIMMDHNFFNADSWQTQTYAPAFAAYSSTHSDGSAAQYSCNALLGFGVPAGTGKSFVDKLWSAAIPTGTYRYYDGTLYMLALLHVSGTFKLWY